MNFFKRVAQSQEIPLEEVSRNQHKLLQRLQMAFTAKIALPVNDALMESTEVVWQTRPLFCQPAKGWIENTVSLLRTWNFYLPHTPSNSLVVDATNQRSRLSTNLHRRIKNARDLISLAARLVPSQPCGLGQLITMHFWQYLTMLITAN